MERATAIDLLTRYFADRDDVVAAYLFGSVARGEARAGSDVDVGVLLRAGKPAAIQDFDFLPLLLRYRETVLRRA